LFLSSVGECAGQPSSTFLQAHEQLSSMNVQFGLHFF
jgi:hypothetical protein